MADVARRYGWLRWLPALAIAGTIVYLSSLTPRELPGPDLLGWDKALHFAAYAALAAAARFASPHALWVLAGVALFGVSDEVHQGFTPGRDPSGWDLLADVAGAAFAMMCWRFVSLPGDTRSRVT